MANHKPLAEVTLLLVEDDPIIGWDVGTSLAEAGAVISGPFRTAAAALAALRNARPGMLPDAAVLDVNLGDHSCEPVARHLAEMGVPFVFHTGNLCDPGKRFFGLPAPVVPKPSTTAEIIAGLRAAMSGNVQPGR